MRFSTKYSTSLIILFIYQNIAIANGLNFLNITEIRIFEVEKQNEHDKLDKGR